MSALQIIDIRQHRVLLSGRGQFFFKKIKEKETHGDKRKKIFFRKRGQEKEKKERMKQSVARLAVTI